MGAKKGLALSVGLWSAANTLHGVITGFYQLLTFRFLLGMGEGSCFPGAARTVYEWFNEKERALANGIAIGGSARGAVIAPPLTIWLSARYGWRAGFVLPGLVGNVWVVGWMAISWKKTDKVTVAADSVKEKVLPFAVILRDRVVWVFIAIRSMLDPIFYFFMFWIPKYLNEQRGLFVGNHRAPGHFSDVGIHAGARVLDHELYHGPFV